MKKEIAAHNATILQVVPSLLDACLATFDHEEAIGNLRVLLCGGEALSLRTQDAFLRRCRAALINLYGPTDAAIDVSAWACREEEGRRTVPIGCAIWNTELYILSSDMRPVPAGVVGELYIGGVGLARGYHGRPGLTGERFVPNPFARRPGERLYRTGDLARWRDDGAIDYVGRIDDQVKIRGFRIELGEIEARLLSHETVREAVVVAQEADTGRRLVGYVVIDEEAAAAGEERSVLADEGSDAAARRSGLIERLKDHLRSALPDYMIPAQIVALDRLPLTPNGKLDRRALPSPDFEGADYRAPQSETERRLAAI